jgi:hypothetical protein
MEFDRFVNELNFRASMQEAELCAKRARAAIDRSGAELAKAGRLLAEAMEGVAQLAPGRPLAAAATDEVKS